MSSDNVIEVLQVSEPNKRIKELCDKAYVTVDDGVPIKRYWRSGKELLRIANIYKEEGQLERAFILYMKYFTLFVEKLPSHIEYNISDNNEKSLSLKNCKAVMPVAEEIKAKLKAKYQLEYDIWLKEKEKRDEEERLRLERLKLEEKKRQEEEEAKRVAEVQLKLNKHIEEAKEKLNNVVVAEKVDLNLDKDVDYVNNSVISEEPITNTTTSMTTVMPPQVDRSSKPSVLMTQGDQGEKFRPVVIPQDLIDKFLNVAKSNTALNRETCAILAGKFSQNCFTITHVLVPAQKGTPDSCQMENEEEVWRIQDEHELFTLGWIHTHPSQSAFMSSIDLHTHYPYQKMLPEAIAIVCAPKHQQVGVFSLTPSHGLVYIAQCRQSGFHPHPKEPPIYEQSNHIIFDNSKKVLLIDLR